MKQNLIFTALLVVLGLQLSTVASAEPLPGAPTQPDHPGSQQYASQLFSERKQFQGRKVDFFAPLELKNQGQKVPLIVFGHGQALGTEHYQLFLEHLARKGYAVVSPQYDSGFMDQDWRRMARDYRSLAQYVAQTYPEVVDANRVIYSGHSKGAYVALVAAGLNEASTPAPASVVLFAPAGFDRELITQMNPQVPVTLVWGESDGIIQGSLMDQIYGALPAQVKQKIVVKDYRGTTPELEADHFFVMSKTSWVGGNNGLSPFHFYGAAKWLIGAAQDLQSGNQKQNRYLYGEEALDKGIERIRDERAKSW